MIMMNLIGEMLVFLSAGVLGLFIGALLAEGALLVPYWRSLRSDDFFALHKEFGPRLYRFYAPLTIAATVLALVAAITSVATAHPGRWSAVTASLLTLSMIAIYSFYFQPANAKFAAASISANELPAELARWAFWHWVRVAIGIIAFAASLLAVQQSY